MKRRYFFIAGALIVVLFGIGLWAGGWSYIRPRVYQKSTQSVLTDIGPKTRKYWKTKLETYPPASVTLLAVKDENVLEVWTDQPKRHLVTFPILKASGTRGPKLREGDRQVPEGIYDITALNPNSSYHLSMRVDYPNRDDLRWAKEEARTQPGSDIFIHGERVSIGCLAMGNNVIEKLFVLVADVGVENSRVVIAPSDPRKAPIEARPEDPSWLGPRYAEISKAFLDYQKR